MKRHNTGQGSKAAVRHRVLFFAEAATLAHVARPMILAKILEDAGYDVHFASHPRYRNLFQELARPWREIHSISSPEFLAALADGRPLYSTAQLHEYVTEDLAVIREIAPDLIIGDFRISLSVSARICGIPYMTVTNAYWSPYARPYYQVPELPITRLFGVKFANVLFKLARPLAFALHTQPLNQVRKHYGLPSLGFDLRQIYTDADQTLYADLPELIPTFERPQNHQYIGPINWSPRVPLPEWWDQLPDEKPVIYVTLGSSGQSNLLPDLLGALAELQVSVISATAGLVSLQQLPDNVFVADYLPGEQAAARAKLVICNGGSPTTMQALSAGVPVIGIASNLDQYLNMDYLRRAGVGTLLRAGQATGKRLKKEIIAILNNSDYRHRAMALKRQIRAYDEKTTFCSLVAAHFPGQASQEKKVDNSVERD